VDEAGTLKFVAVVCMYLIQLEPVTKIFKLLVTRFARFVVSENLPIDLATTIFHPLMTLELVFGICASKMLSPPKINSLINKSVYANPCVHF